MATIFACRQLRPPGKHHARAQFRVAGTMVANRSGLRMSTLRNIAAAWVFTLPVAALLSGSPVLALRHFA